MARIFTETHQKKCIALLVFSIRRRWWHHKKKVKLTFFIVVCECLFFLSFALWVLFCFKNNKFHFLDGLVVCMCDLYLLLYNLCTAFAYFFFLFQYKYRNKYCLFQFIWVFVFIYGVELNPPPHMNAHISYK